MAVQETGWRSGSSRRGRPSTLAGSASKHVVAVTATGLWAQAAVAATRSRCRRLPVRSGRFRREAMAWAKRRIVFLWVTGLGLALWFAPASLAREVLTPVP